MNSHLSAGIPLAKNLSLFTVEDYLSKSTVSASSGHVMKVFYHRVFTTQFYV
jgi:hypothetical protein